MFNKNHVFIIFADLAIMVLMILLIGLGIEANKKKNRQNKEEALIATIEKPVAKLTKVVNKAAGEVNYIDFYSFGQFVGKNTDKPFGEMLDSYLFFRDFKMQGKRDLF